MSKRAKAFQPTIMQRTLRTSALLVLTSLASALVTALAMAALGEFKGLAGLS